MNPSSPPPTWTARLALTFGASLITLICAEAFLSLVSGRSLRDLLRSAADAPYQTPLVTQTDHDRLKAAAALPGPYRVDDDPDVGYVYKADATFELEQVMVTTDALGLRARPVPEPEEPYRIVVLGDSVAFGWGLEDDQTLAAQLERRLTEARDAQGRPFACRTVAIPSWNAHNAMQFLIGRFDVLRPDLVLFVYVSNDLNDSYSAYETGHRRTPLGETSRMFVARPGAYLTFLAVDRLPAAGRKFRTKEMGPDTIELGLVRESSQRLDAATHRILKTHQYLKRNGAQLWMVPYQRSGLHLALWDRVHARAPAIPVAPLVMKITKPDTLIRDPHPNATTVSAFAAWLAKDLVEQSIAVGSVDTDVPDEMAGRRDDRPSDEEHTRRLNEVVREAISALRPVVSDVTGEGTMQILGGIQADGTMGPRLLVVLPASPNQLTVRLRAFDDRPDLTPLRVDVSVDEEPVGFMELTGGLTEATFTLPTTDQPRQVSLDADTWVMRDVRGRSTPASAHFVECVLE